MPRWPTRSVDLLILTFAAGELDAVAYLRGHAFVANMTGNSALLGLAIFGQDRGRAAACLVSLAGFLAGAALAAYALLRRRGPRHPAADLHYGVVLELPALGVFLGLWLAGAPSLCILAAAACALGTQSVAVRRLQISGVVTTFITGTLTTAVVETIGLPETRNSASAANSLLLAAMFFTYVTAAAAGALLSRFHPAVAPAIPVALAGLVAARSRKASTAAGL